MNISGARILVTGGAGFIGSHIVDSLVESGAEVLIYDNFSSGFLDNIKHHEKRVAVIKDDILNYASLERAMDGIDIVSHQAAQLEIFLATSKPEHDLEVNTIGTLNVLKAAKQKGVSKVLNASSACVYGQVNSASREDDNVTPNWTYGVSKLAAEKYAQIYNDYNGLPVVSFRYGIVYGEREWYRRVLPIFLKRVINGESPVIFGQGEQVRDFVYVKDLVALHNICIENDDANGQVFNVGTGKGTTVVELAETAVTLSDLKLEILFEDTKEGEFSKLVGDKKRNAAELKTMLLDISKANRLLAWEPRTSLRDGLKAEFDWAKQNLSRWDKINYTSVS